MSNRRFWTVRRIRGQVPSLRLPRELVGYGLALGLLLLAVGLDLRGAPHTVCGLGALAVMWLDGRRRAARNVPTSVANEKAPCPSESLPS